MTNHDNIKSMSLDAFVDFLDKYSIHESTPWSMWWEQNYCGKCNSISVNAEKQKELLGFISLKENIDCAYCEIYDHCKYFPEKHEVSLKDVLKLWLEEEYKDEEL